MEIPHVQHLKRDKNSAFEALFEEYKYQNQIICRCQLPIEALCVSNCGQASLHCMNKQCPLSFKLHKKCRVIYLQGLTQKLRDNIDSKRKFLECIFEIEEQLIKEIRQRRQQIVDSFQKRQFSTQVLKAIHQIYTKKNIQFNQGFYLRGFYQQLQECSSFEKSLPFIQSFRVQFDKIKSKVKLITKNIQESNLFTIKALYLPTKTLKQNNSEERQKINFILSTLQNPKEIRLLFRASENQFKASKFYQKCDRLRNILVVVKTKFGKIIGGFSPTGWNSLLNQQWGVDHQEQSFIFSADLKQKMSLVDHTKAIGNNTQWGPSFGLDIQLADKCNNNTNSVSNFPNSYNYVPQPYKNSQNSKEAFTGSKEKIFGVEDYEVFEVIK